MSVAVTVAVAVAVLPKAYPKVHGAVVNVGGGAVGGKVLPLEASPPADKDATHQQSRFTYCSPPTSKT